MEHRWLLVSLLMAGLLVWTFGPAQADYKLYLSKGFTRVVEIVEQTPNPDGTITVKARKSRGDAEIVEYPDVVRIEETEAGIGVAPMKDLPPTPTPPNPLGRPIGGTGPAPGPDFRKMGDSPQPGPAPSDPAQTGQVQPSSASGEHVPLVKKYPVLDAFVRKFSYAFIGGIVLVLVLFMFFKTRK